MLQHYPDLVFSLGRPLTVIGFWVFFELAMWGTIHILSEKGVMVPGSRWELLRRSFNALARRRRVAVLVVFLVAFLGRLALLPITHVPSPKIADEFSQVLAADTFAHWRVTNATHPMSLYFETLMENQTPTYQSMYPPTTGLILGIAQMFTGHPWYGVLFSVAAASAGICWMLQGWVSPGWALWGALVFIPFAARDGLTESYISAGITILGGALILGAIPRIVRQRHFASAIWLGIGVSLLATTRPYEGAVLVTGLGIGGLYWARAASIGPRTLLRNVAAPVAVLLIPAFLGVGYFNWRSTGNPLLAPYQVNMVQQHITRPFIWQKPVTAPHYDHAAMAAFYQEWEVNWWQGIARFPRGTVLFVISKAQVLYSSVLWPLTLFVAIGCWQLLKDKDRRILVWALGIFAVGISLETYQLLAWYLGPAVSLLFLLAIFGIRYVSTWKRPTHLGFRMVRAAKIMIPAAYLACAVMSYGSSWYHLANPYPEHYYQARMQLQAGLEKLPGKQLVIVRYSSSHIPFEEWVHNRADIDASKVVWARDIPERGNADLLEYFKDRTVWLLEPDGTYPILTAYRADKRIAGISEVGGFPVTGLGATRGNDATGHSEDCYVGGYKNPGSEESR